MPSFDSPAGDPDESVARIIRLLGLFGEPAGSPSEPHPLCRIYRGGRRADVPALLATDILDILGDVVEHDGHSAAGRWAWMGAWSEDNIREVFVHRESRAILTWARGELTLVMCATSEAFTDEIARCDRFYRMQRSRRRPRRAVALA